MGWSLHVKKNLILRWLQDMNCTQVSQIPQGCNFLMITTPPRTVFFAIELEMRGIFLTAINTRLIAYITEPHMLFSH